MTDLFPPIEPNASGMLATGDGNQIYWEECGNPTGKPAVVFHGGPGSGCTEWHRRLFNPSLYRIVLFDQRGCGRSRPHASEPGADLSNNNTPTLLLDIDRLRHHLGIDRWLVVGGSWGSTLALAYAEANPDPVSQMILFGVTTGRWEEFDWLFRGGLARLFPAEWERLRAHLPFPEPDADIVDAYHRLLNDSDPEVCQRAAESWCLWESASPSWPPRAGLAERFTDPAFALAFARLVTHYIRHNAWLEDGALIRGAGSLAGIPGILVHGRFDLQAPLGNAWALHRAWTDAELIVVDDAGHDAGNASITSELVRAIERFATFPS